MNYRELIKMVVVALGVTLFFVFRFRAIKKAEREQLARKSEWRTAA